ncbi:carboxylesterase [Exilibacterium tricleocarpae]|uniref:Carboxylesterase n=1 Tax=Exilibacterium tricleocarpae TaxID=2591008 RepID=A0A545T658_9GAMM|nr:carboxylesterase [Exilibacterium tricleocarpae]TQV72704.1 carboxylesterase [Exilibacterium tricleocarpae]
MTYLPCVEIEPATPATAAVIWLHGLGANGHDFEPIVPELKLPATLPVRFVFPHAPSIPVTINGGAVMPAWYDILEMTIDRKIDEAQILRSAAAVTALIEREIERGIPSNRIVVAGFSQGGAVAYQAALSCSRPLAGLMALSTYFATHQSINPSEANHRLPIHIYHGVYDPVVPETLGRRAHDLLLGMGYTTDYKNYPMEHAVCPAQITDMSQWLQKQLGK